MRLWLEATEDTVTLAMSDPADLQAIDNLEVFVSHLKKITIAVTPEQQLLDAFDNLYRRTGEIAKIAGELRRRICR